MPNLREIESEASMSVYMDENPIPISPIVNQLQEEWQDLLTEAGSQLVVADFWATWCGPCRMIGPHFERMSDEEQFADVIFAKVDVDECGELAEEFEIEVMPTFFFFKDGKKVAEMSGANQAKLRELLEEHANKE